MADEPQEGIGLHISSDPDETRILAQPEDAGVKQAVQLPLRLLLISDLAPQAATPDWTGPSRLRSVDKYRFADLMQETAPRLVLEVPNEISEAPKTLDVELQFTRLEDFHPERIARQVPSLAHLLAIRTLVGRVKTGEIDPPTLQARMKETGVDPDWAEQLYQALMTPPKPAPPPAPPPKPSPKKTGGDDALDRLLGMVDLGGSASEAEPAPPEAPAETGTRSFMDALVQAVSGGTSSQPKVETSAADLLLADLDDTLSGQLNVLLGHEAFRALEAAWRGLKFLVDRIDFREDIQLEVLAAGKEDLSEALYHQVLLPEHGDSGKPPLSAVVLDFAFGHGLGEVRLLEDLAETAASLQTPFIASVDHSFFGVAQMTGLDALPGLQQFLEKPEYIVWNKFRDQPDATYLALALPPFLLRYPYGSDDPVEAFPFEETSHLWGGGTLVVAAAIAGSFAQTGWPTHLTGAAGNRIENLPIWKSKAGAIPLAALISERKQGELAEAGFVVLGCKQNHDAAFIARAPTAFRPPVYESDETTAEARVHAMLASRLFVARAAHSLLVIQNEIASGASLAEAQAEVEARLRAFLSTGGQAAPEDAVTVEHMAEANLPDHEVLAVRLRPPASVLGQQVSLVMGIQVPKEPDG